MKTFTVTLEVQIDDNKLDHTQLGKRLQNTLDKHFNDYDEDEDVTLQATVINVQQTTE